MEPDTPEKKPTATDKILDAAAEKFNWWNRMAAINTDDPVWVMAIKIGIRAIGILFLLAISPFVILGLILGIIAAG